MDFCCCRFPGLGLIGVWYCNELFYGKTLLPQPAASDHGEKIDHDALASRSSLPGLYLSLHRFCCSGLLLNTRKQKNEKHTSFRTIINWN